MPLTAPLSGHDLTMYRSSLQHSPAPKAAPVRSNARLPTGVADARALPDAEFLDLWNAILVDPQLKQRLLAQAVLNFTLRPSVSRAKLPLHGVLLLVGPPGTGKTSLAKGLASRTAEVLREMGRFQFVEVDPHALSSGSLGKTQQAVTALFGSTVTEYAAQGPTIVLLDEVETVLADRAKLSLEANPVDVHRATDAALVQLDHIAESHPNVLFIATSNFPQAIDEAFISRADLVLTVPLPDENGRLAILQDTLGGMVKEYPALRELAASRNLARVAKACDGLDGRAVRKVIAAACASDMKTALDPGLLQSSHLLDAATAAAAERANVRSAGTRKGDAR